MEQLYLKTKIQSDLDSKNLGIRDRRAIGLVKNSNIDDIKFQKIPSALQETHCVSKEPNQKMVKFTLNPNEFVRSVDINKTNYLIPNKSLQYILPKSVQQMRIPITRNPPNSKLVEVSGKPRMWECPSHLRKDLIYLNEKLRKLGKIQIMEIAKHIKDITKDKKQNFTH